MRKALAAGTLVLAVSAAGVVTPAAAQSRMSGPLDSGGSIGVTRAAATSPVSGVLAAASVVAARRVAVAAASVGFPGHSTGAGVRIRTSPSTAATIVGHLQRWERVWVACQRVVGITAWYSLRRGSSPGPAQGWASSAHVRVFNTDSPYGLRRC